MSGPDFLSIGREVMQAEATALAEGALLLDGNFQNACEFILGCQGKIILSGLGKSGHIARKIASTFSSTGSPALFLHPSEALHGDLGTVSDSDVVVAIAQSGETPEILSVVQYARRIGAKVIAITGSHHSSLAQSSDALLSSRVSREACLLNLAPTSSSTLTLAIGDALAVAVMSQRGFATPDFAKFHPGGSIGRKLAETRQLMVPISQVPCVSPDSRFIEVIEAITKANLGITGVLDPKGLLLGAITDGDIRRALKRHAKNAIDLSAKEMMTAKPKTIRPELPAVDAVKIMEDHRITSLFVAETANEGSSLAYGIIRLHDIMGAKIF
jgi:arabinose-5-phosphate isomerase